MRFRKYISKEEAKKIWPNDKVYPDRKFYSDGNEPLVNIDIEIDPEIRGLTKEKIIAHLLQEKFGEE